MDHRAELLREIEAFIAERQMAETTFGRLAVNDGKFVARLRARKNLTFDTAERARAFIALERAAKRGQQPVEAA